MMRRTKDFNNAALYLIGTTIIWMCGTAGAAAAIAGILSLASLPFFKVFWMVIWFTVIITGSVILLLLLLGGLLGRNSFVTIKTFRCVHCGTLDAAHTVSDANMKCSYCGKYQKPRKHVYIKGDINDR